MAERVALFGGSFNPVHHGHLIIVRAIAERLALHRVIFLPSAAPPNKVGERLADPVHRAAMVRLAIEQEPLFDFSDYDLTRDGPSYTIETVNHFRGLEGSDVELFWIIGADSLVELATWHRVGELVGACRIVTAARLGPEDVLWDDLRGPLTDRQIEQLRADCFETPVIEVSSTDIRRRIRDGASIRFLVPESVRQYIQQHHLYG